MKRHFTTSFCVFAFFTVFISPHLHAQPFPGDLALAPPAFQLQSRQVVPVDFDRMELNLRFDIPSRQGMGSAKIWFRTGQAGYPMLDLVPNPTSVRLNGAELGPEGLPLVRPPGSSTQVRVAVQPVQPGQLNLLEIDYPLLSGRMKFSSTGVSTAFFFSDLEDRRFLELYAPANYEYDQFSMKLAVTVSGAKVPHQIFANGRVSARQQESVIEYPSYFTSSSFYFHLTETPFVVKKEILPGLQRPIPVTVYSRSAALTDQGMKTARAVLQELETTYGPFPHEQLVIYITGSGGGGMEYCGATASAVGNYVLSHELTHSWFARSVMPANGNAGWIDEAIAMWRGDGYERASGIPSRSTVNLAGFSPYRRHTPQEAYSKGKEFITELDFLFREKGGMKTQLRALFARMKNRPITTQIFENFLQQATQMDLGLLFKRYVYGIGAPQRGFEPPLRPVPSEIFHKGFTREEFQRML